MNSIEKCKAYMSEKDISQAKLASKIGISESTFSRYLKGSYPTPESIEEKINAFFEKENARREASFTTDIDFAMTGISEVVLNVLEYTRLQKIIGIIYGDAGIGKTFTCNYFMKERPDVIMVTANPAFASPKPFLKLLLRSLKISFKGSLDEMLMEAFFKLENGDKMIIIDEAQHLTRRTLEIVRSINDITKSAIVLVGNEVIHSKLTGKQEAEFAQLFSRISMRSGSLLTDMFKEEDIVKIFAEVKDKKALLYMLKICKSPHGLRGAVHTYNNAKNNKDLTFDGLKAMASLMGIVA